MPRGDRDFPASYAFGSVLDGNPNAPPLHPRHSKSPVLNERTMPRIYGELFRLTGLTPQDLLPSHTEEPTPTASPSPP